MCFSLACDFIISDIHAGPLGNKRISSAFAENHAEDRA